MRLLIMFLIAMTYQGALASKGIQPSCKATPVQDKRVKGRAHTVTFPNGRMITVVGHTHGTRQVYEAVDFELSGRLQEMSDADFNEFLKRIERDNKAKKLTPAKSPKVNSVTHDSENDYSFLYDALSGSTGLPPVEFVGFEGTDSARHSNLRYFTDAYYALIREYTIRGERARKGVSPTQLRKIIKSSMNGHIFLYVEKPQLTRSAPMFGTEDEVAARLHDESAPLEKMYQLLLKLKADDAAYWKTRPQSEAAAFKASLKDQAFAERLVQLYNDVFFMEIYDLDDLELRISKIEPTEFPWLAESTLALFEEFRNRLRVNIARDRSSAVAMANRFQSGIHFVGRNHLKSTISILEYLCSAEASYPAYSNPSHSTSVYSKTDAVQ